MNEYIYTKILAPVIQNLYSEVLIIGLFIVGFSYLQGIFFDKKSARNSYFWRRVLLLSSVMLFTIYVVLSYNVDIAVGKIDYNIKSWMTPQIFFLLIAWVELAMVSLTGAMFLILSYGFLTHTAKSEKVDEDQTNKKSEKTLAFLFGATGLWHILCIVWWLFWIGDQRFSLYSIYIHGIIASVHIISLLIWNYITSSKFYLPHYNLYNWIGDIWYFIIILTVYIIRMGWYADSVIKAVN